MAFAIQDFTYITDAKSISEPEKEKIRGSQVLVLNALQHDQHISHFTLEEALSLIEELQPTQTYLTHIGHRLGLHREVSAMLPDGVALAYDGLTVEVNSN